MRVFRFYIFGFAFVGAALLMLIGLHGCEREPQKITWTMHKGSRPEDYGWHPKDNTDITYVLNGDFDFTLIEDGPHGEHAEFHQRCWSIGMMRNALPPNQNAICGVWAHFARDIPVADGIELARKVLIEWDGGLRDDPRGGISLDEFAKLVKDGKAYMEQYGFQGRTSGVIRITLLGKREEGLKQKCSLYFSPG